MPHDARVASIKCASRADLWACQLKIIIKGNAGITKI